MARSLGLDIGDSRIGAALSDPQGILATPFTIIHRKDEAADCRAIADIITQNQVEQVIVGLPYNMDGSLGGQAEKVKAFVSALSGQIAVPVTYGDRPAPDAGSRRQKEQGEDSRRRHSSGGYPAGLSG